jgi:hypothetical protein
MTAAKGLRGPVLAAIDLTDAADEVLTQANAIAVSLRTKLIVSHVVHETLQARMLFPQFAGMDAARQAAFEQQVREAVKARIAAVAMRAISEVDVAVDSGSAHAGIEVNPSRGCRCLARFAPAFLASHSNISLVYTQTHHRHHRMAAESPGDPLAEIARLITLFDQCSPTFFFGEKSANSLENGAPAATRTRDPRLRRPVLYPTVRRVYLRLLAHRHEHMGQLIGFVMGMNGPWPRRPQLLRPTPANCLCSSWKCCAMPSRTDCGPARYPTKSAPVPRYVAGRSFRGRR